MIYNIKIITLPTTFIVLEVELPFKCNFDNFIKIYQEHYKNRISHDFIRNNLNLSESIRLKLNGTFERWLYLLDGNNCIYRILYKVQTAVWFNDETGKWQYVSIFPNFIKKYCQQCLDMFEYISCNVRKGENVFEHIDDPEGLFDCEDRITKPLRRIEKECMKFNYPALLNSRYTDIYNRPLPVTENVYASTRRFSVLFALLCTARHFFGKQQGVISLVNKIIFL